MYENLYGLSCVENQVLAQLRASGMDISVLYAVDVDFERLFEEMMVKGEKPEFFSLIPKIQDVLKDAGVISLERKESPSAEECIAILNQGVYKVFLMIKPDFVKQKLYARGLREDHYVLIEKTGERFTLYNDLPETTAMVTASELGAIYSGSYFTFGILRDLAEQEFFRVQSSDPQDIKFPISVDMLQDIQDIGQRFRNFMWIYKTLVYRYTEYNSKIIAKKTIKASREYADNIFALSEYLYLKRTNSAAKYCDLLNEVYTADCILKNGAEVMQHVH